jgi:hypothetical protein
MRKTSVAHLGDILGCHNFRFIGKKRDFTTYGFDTIQLRWLELQPGFAFSVLGSPDQELVGLSFACYSGLLICPQWMNHGRQRYQAGPDRYSGSRSRNNDWDRQRYLMHVLHPRNCIWIMTVRDPCFT